MELRTSLQSLRQNFSTLIVAVQSALVHKLQHRLLKLEDVTIFIKYELYWVEELSDINKCNDLDKLFKKLHPYFDFLDCEIIIRVSERFLNDECFGEDKNLVSELKKHMDKAETLRCSFTVKQLKDQLKSIYTSHLGDLTSMPQIYIELHNPWNDANIQGLYLLVRHLLPHPLKQSLLKYITIDTGSVCIKYIVHDSTADCLIAYAQDKLHFMRLIGIFGLTINGQSILEEDENMNFSFESALQEATKAGHNEAVKFLLKLGGDINHCNEEGKTALILASEKGHHQVVELLLKENADINIQEKDGWSALMIASHNGHHQVVELLKAHADINTQNKNGVTALMLASEEGHERIVKSLASAGANVNIQENEGWTALMRASELNHLTIVNTLIQHGADPNLQKSNGSNALMIASFYGHYDIVQVLLQQKTDINYQRKDGGTALLLASYNGHHQVVELLLKEHADIDRKRNDGLTSLMLASFNGHTQVVKLLLQWDADVSILNEYDYNALMVASQNGHLEIVECLLQSHADPHLLSSKGSTAFSLAAYSGNRDLVNMLLDKVKPTTEEIEKAVVLSCLGGHPIVITFLSNKLSHLTNDQRELLDSCVKGTVVMKTLDSPDTPLVLGLTPLMVASSCGHVDIVVALIKAGADVNKQESFWGFTPLFFAIRGGKSFTIVETLLERNADPNAIADKRTPLDDANDIKQESISKLLSKYGGQTREKVERAKEKESKSLSLPFDTLNKSVKPCQPSFQGKYSM